MYTNAKTTLTFFLFLVLFTIAGRVCAQTSEKIELPDPKMDTSRVDSSMRVGIGDMREYADSTAIISDSIGAKKKSSLQHDVNYNAIGYIEYDYVANKVYLYDQAEVTYGDIKLTAGYIEIDQTSGNVYARYILDSLGLPSQKPIFEQGGKPYDAYAMTYNIHTQRGYIKNVKMEETEGYGAGREVLKEGEDVFYASDFYFSTDEKLRGWIDGTGEETDYYIRSSRVKMTAGENLVAGVSQMYIADIPTPLVLPFAFFPLNNMPSSGILMPSYNISKDQGFGLVNGGYYFVFNDYLHAQVMGDIYTKGSWALRTSLNYYWKYHFSGTVSFDYSKVVYSEIGLPGYSKSAPWRLGITHRQDPKWTPDLTLSASVNLSSSGYYENSLDQIYNNNYINNSVTSSSINLSKRWGNSPFNLGLNISQSQNNSTGQMSLTMPSFNFSMNRIFPFKKADSNGNKWFEKINLSWNMTGQNTINSMPIESFMTEDMWKYARMGVTHSIPINATYKVLKYFNLGLNFNYNEAWDLKTVQKHWDQDQGLLISDTISGFKALRTFNTGVSLSTVVFGTFNFSENGGLRAIRHVMSPSLSYSFTPDFSTPFWGYYYSVQTGDQLGAVQNFSYFQAGLANAPAFGAMSQSLSFSLSNNFEAKIADKSDSTGVKTKKLKLLDNLSTSISYNFAASQFKLSNIPLSGGTSFFNNRIGWNFRFDFSPYKIDEDYKLIDEYTIPRLVSGGTNINFSISNNDFKKKTKDSDQDKKKKSSDSDSNGYYKDGYLEYEPEWSLSVGYTYSYSKYSATPSITNSVSLNGSLKFSKNWSMEASTGYDFQAKKMADLRFNFARQLGTWYFTLSWAPISYYSNYSFFIGVKASMLKDLKYEQNNNYRKNFFR